MCPSILCLTSTPRRSPNAPATRFACQATAIPAHHARLPALPNDIEALEAVGKATERAFEAVEEGTVLLSPRRHSSFDFSQANFAVGIDDADSPDQVIQMPVIKTTFPLCIVA